MNFTDTGTWRGFESSTTWRGPIPVATVDISLPLFGSTVPARFLPEEPLQRGEYFEPLPGLAVREMFQTGVFPNLFGTSARPETLGLSRRDILLASESSPTDGQEIVKKITLAL
jgi:hypothetical protein